MRICFRFALLILLTCVAMTSVGLADESAKPRRQPNIVILLADDLGYADVGFQGCQDIPTPRIDALAKGGVRCKSGYVSGPYCSPSRAGLLTGRYQQRFGHEFNPGGGHGNAAGFGLPVTETTIADRLRAAGYATAHIGKWHLGDAPKYRPLQRGFEHSFGFLAGHHLYFPGEDAPLYRGDDIVQEQEYLTDAFAREAVSFIAGHKARPFFLFLAFNAVHTPMQATADRLKRFAGIADERRRAYAAMASAMDDAIGRVMDALKSHGLEEETLIFFLSDNGGPTMTGTTINGSSNAPLRGSKRTTLEGGIRVPFVVHWKGKLPAGKVYDQPVIQLDILPTALAAAGIAVPRDAGFDGVDLVPRLGGQIADVPHEALYWRLGEQMALRQGDWKIVRYDSAVDGGTAGKATSLRLYNLAEDIGETHDLAASRPEKVQELEAVWQKWNAQLVAPLW